jgi:hypothetical protein
MASNYEVGKQSSERGPRDMFFVPDKDPNFEYYWANQADRNMIQMTGDGWEVVRGASELPGLALDPLRQITGQENETPVASEVRRRGDLILMRMPKDLYDERVRQPEIAARERQQCSLDTLVERANESSRAALQRANQKQIRPRHVFQTSDDNKFDDQSVSKG